jgi:Zn-finger nucleic acid-binding protein
LECGGLWFDNNEIYAVKHGSASKIEKIDYEKLKKITHYKKTKLNCPRHEIELVKFNDRFFPYSIDIESCPICGGFWFDHGEFTVFQHERQQKISQFSRYDRYDRSTLKKILEAESGSQYDSLGRISKFLSQPNKGSLGEEVHVYTQSAFSKQVCDIIIIILRNLIQYIFKI